MRFRGLRNLGGLGLRELRGVGVFQGLGILAPLRISKTL